MATSNYQKIKMLKLMEMLRRDADEANPMTTEEICRCLIAMEISLLQENLVRMKNLRHS